MAKQPLCTNALSYNEHYEVGQYNVAFNYSYSNNV